MTNRLRDLTALISGGMENVGAAFDTEGGKSIEAANQFITGQPSKLQKFRTRPTGLYEPPPSPPYVPLPHVPLFPPRPPGYENPTRILMKATGEAFGDIGNYVKDAGTDAGLGMLGFLRSMLRDRKKVPTGIGAAPPP